MIKITQVRSTIIKVCARATGSHLAALGDRARDRLDWREAAEYYRKYLCKSPRSSAIWVQLGHALKESGDRAGGLDAYLRAIEVDGANSDTALQIGHVLKLLDRKAEAIEWYSRAVKWPPHQADAINELVNLGISTDEIDTLLESALQVEEEYAEETATVTPEGPLLWDITAFTWAVLANEVPPIEATWSVALGLGLSKQRAVGLCALTRDTLEWRQVSSDLDMLHEVLAGRAISHSLQFEPLPESASCLIFNPWDGLEPEQIVLALRTLSEIKRLPVIAHLSLGGKWTNAEQFEQGTARALRHMDALLQTCGAILTWTNHDAEVLKSRLQAKGLDRVAVTAVPEVIRRSENKLDTANQPSAAYDMALLPADTEELLALRAAHQCFEPGRKLVFVAHSADADVASAQWKELQNKLNLEDFEVIPASYYRVKQKLAQAGSFVLPGSRADDTLWASVACDEGVPVIASLSPKLYRLFGGALDDYADFREATVLAERWAGLGRRRVGGHGKESTRWVVALDEAVGRLIADEKAMRRCGSQMAIVGKFYSLDKDGDGLGFRLQPGWLQAAPYGSALEADGAHLRIKLGNHSKPCRMKALFATPRESGGELTLQLSCGGKTRSATINVPEDGWGWASCDFDLNVSGSNVLDVYLRGPAAGHTVLGGFITYPISKDSLWFDFLDLASRGKVPVLRAIKAWAGRGHDLLKQGKYARIEKATMRVLETTR